MVSRSIVDHKAIVDNKARVLYLLTAVYCFCFPTVGEAQFRSDSKAYLREHSQVDTAVYSRYNRPGQCVAATIRADWRYLRFNSKDTLAIAPQYDTLPDIATEVAKVCRTVVGPHRVDISEVSSKILLDMFSDDTVLAFQRIRELVDSVKLLPPESGSHILGELVFHIIQSKPKQIEDIKFALGAMESLGKPGADYRLESFRTISQLALNWNRLDLSIDLGVGAEKAWLDMTSAERSDNVASASGMLSTLADAVRINSDVDSANKVIDRAKPSMLATRESGSQQQQMINNWVEGARANYPFYGTDVRTIQATNWFNDRGDSTPRPRRGVVTVIAFAEPSCSSRCYPLYSMIRRWHEKYASRGLEIVVVAKTNGFFRTQLTLDPEVEIDLMQKYFLEFLKLPVTLAITETQFSRIHDGRRIPETSPNQAGWPQGDLLLANSKGQISGIFFSGIVGHRWQLIEAQIEKALAR